MFPHLKVVFNKVLMYRTTTLYGAVGIDPVPPSVLHVNEIQTTDAETLLRKHTTGLKGFPFIWRIATAGCAPVC